MRLFKIIFLLLSSLFFIAACSPIGGFHKVDLSKAPKSVSVIDTLSEKTVFKAGISVYDNYFSGLFLFKPIKADSSYRIVFMSEVGLNLLDMVYKNDTMTVLSCNDFLNKKIILNTMKKDFAQLFMKYTIKKRFKVYANENDSVQVVKFSYKWKKFYYFCHNQNDIFRIYRKSKIFGSVNMNVDKNKNLGIDGINFKHRGIKLEINLVRINKGE